MPLWTARPAAHSLRHLGKGRAKAQRPGRGWLSCPTCAHSEVKLSVVTYLTNSIVDEILQELYHSHKSLVRLLNPSQARAHPPPVTLSPPSNPLPKPWKVGSFPGNLFTPVLPQARHLAQLKTLSDPPSGPGQGQDLSSRGRGRNHDHEETTDDELGTNIVSAPPLPALNEEPPKHCPPPFLWTALSPVPGPGLISPTPPQIQPRLFPHPSSSATQGQGGGRGP